MTALWFPDYPNNAAPPFVLDARFDDFDAQSERLAGHDQDYLQLSPGPFLGRFCSVFFGPSLSVHIELANQSLEQNVTFASDQVTLGLVLSDQREFLADGIKMSREHLMISPPGATLNLVSPANGAIIAICVEKDLLAMHCPDDDTADCLVNGPGIVQILHLPQIAGRLRQDVFMALENRVLQPSAGILPGLGSVGHALIHSITANLALYNATTGLSSAKANNTSRELFMRAKRAITRNAWEEDDYSLLARKLGYSTRSIQTAFSRNSDLTPYEYIRIVRLNKVRRELTSGNAQGETIGDLASRFGFWNWSRFSGHYKSQFGELPSQTRQNTLNGS